MATRSVTTIACCALLSAASTHGATLGVADLNPNSLVISEYLANPVGVADADGEYFEIFNATAHTIDLDGLVVRDDGSNQFTVPGVSIGPLSFAVFSSADGAPLGITPAFVYGGSMALTNADDEIGLYRPDDSLINKVAYTDGDSFGAGIAHELSALNASTPVLLFGPTLGMDFVAATDALPLGNFGSPGGAGNTLVDVPAVPLPAAAWMFMSALGILGWLRKRGPAPGRPTGDRHARDLHSLHEGLGQQPLGSIVRVAGRIARLPATRVRAGGVGGIRS